MPIKVVPGDGTVCNVQTDCKTLFDLDPGLSLALLMKNEPLAISRLEK